MARHLTALLLAFVATGAAAQDDLEARFQQRLAACKDNGAGTIRVARFKVERDRPRLLSALPSLDVSQYCECKYEARRAEFGLETALKLDSVAGDRELGPPQALVELHARDDRLLLDCIERAATGGQQFSDPAEAQLADLVDQCHSTKHLLEAFAAMFLQGDSPDKKQERLAGLDRSTLCSCFYEGQRAAFGLADALAFNSMTGPGRGIGWQEGKQILARKSAIFEDCVAGRAPAAAAGGEGSEEGAAHTAAPEAARSNTLGIVVFALLLAAVIAGTTLYYRRRQELERQARQRRQQVRPRPSPRR